MVACANIERFLAVHSEKNNCVAVVKVWKPVLLQRQVKIIGIDAQIEIAELIDNKRSFIVVTLESG